VRSSWEFKHVYILYSVPGNTAWSRKAPEWQVASRWGVVCWCMPAALLAHAQIQHMLSTVTVRETFHLLMMMCGWIQCSHWTHLPNEALPGPLQNTVHFLIR
jgi:hypothetical protein